MNGDRPLDNPINWSFKIGRLFDIDIRVHVVFVICALILVWMEIPKDSEQSWSLGRVLINALGIYAMLFFIVLVHEFGHCWGARYTGGEAHEILLWPLGGLAYVHPPHKARAHMITTIAGPMVNVIFCVITAAVLVLWLGRFGAVPWNPIRPMWPADSSIVPTSAQLWVMRFFGLSYFILLINLLPVFPFDGGRIVQAWLWPRKGYERSMEIATGTGMIGAILIGAFGLFLGQSWLLLMIAVFGYMNCWHLRRVLKEGGAYALAGEGADFQSGYTFFDDGGDEENRRPGFFERRRNRKAAERERRERERKSRHEEAVEAILRKVSLSGMDSLTPGERRLLEEETNRKRTAQGS